MHIRSLSRLCETAILVLLAFAILWKGGKTLESTWLLVGVAAGCWLLIPRLWSREAEENDRKLWYVVLLFILWTAFSYFFSRTQNYGLDEVLRDGALGLLLLWYLRRGHGTLDLGLGVASDPRATDSFEERFLIWLARLTIASCVIGVFIYIFQPVNRFVGTFVDPRFHTDYWPNAFAEFLLLAWPVVLWYQLSKKPTQGKHYCFLLTTPTSAKPTSPRLRGPGASAGRHYSLLALIFGSLLLTYSRGAFIAFLGQVVLLLALLFTSRDGGREHRTTLTILASSLLIGMFVFLCVNGIRAYVHPVQPLGEKLSFSAAEGTSSVFERKEFWKQAALLSLQKPLFGWGPGSFRFVQPRLQEAVLATSDHPHNVLLKLAMERGIVTPFLFAIIVATALLSGIRVALTGKRLCPSDHMRLLAPLLTTALGGVLAHNLIDFNLQFVGIALPLWLMMGMLLRGMEHGKENRTMLLPTPYSLLPILAALLLLIAFREGIYLVTSSIGRHAEARGDGNTALRWYEASEQEWFTRDLELSKAHLLLREEKVAEAEMTVRSYLKKNREDARAWKFLGTVLTTEGDFPAAIEALEQAFAFGSWNDLSISSSLLEALFAETYTQPTSDAAADSARLPLHPRLALITPEIERRVLAFAEAIERNHHFVALSPNPEEAVKILITLSVLYERKEELYRGLRETIEAKTQEERAKIKARSPGMLW